MSTDQLVLEVNNVSVRFGGIAALSDVSFSLSAGKTKGVIGPNGAGKTTLFDVASGYLKPSQGQIRMSSGNVSNRSAAWRARHGMARTFQRQQTFGALTVFDNVRVAIEGDRLSGGVFLDLVGASRFRRTANSSNFATESILERCGLSGVSNEPASSLPIGLARMLEFARAIATQPSVLLLDEPTSGLGSSETAQFARILRESLTDLSCGVLLVEHDISFIMNVSDEILVLDLGRTITEGTPHQVQKDPLVREAYLGMMGTRDDATTVD